MNKKITLCFSLLVCISVLFISCNNKKNTNENTYGAKNKELIKIVESNQKIKSLLQKAINKAHEINPDTSTNPVQNIKDFYKFI